MYSLKHLCATSVSAVLALLFLFPAFASAQIYILDPQTGFLRPAQQQAQFTQAGQSTHSLQTQIQQLQLLIIQLQQFIATINQGGNVVVPPTSTGPSEIDITTESATDIEDNRARLNGRIDFNASDFAYYWFEWGEDDDDLDEQTPRIRRDDDEDEDFFVTITRLDEDQRYHFRAAGQDDRGRIDRGSIRSFTTDDDQDDDDDDDDRDNEPDVETQEADDVTDDSAELSGEVDMNDFRNGLVFLVYGEDEDQIEDIESDFDSFDDVDEDGDLLQKVDVDSDLDDSMTYTVDIDGLDDNTEYFFNFCVEYEDEDDDETLTCGSVEEFETD